MNIQELRRLVSEVPRFPGAKLVRPASVCNEGFPGTFNLSYSEAEMIEQFGQYLDYKHDFIYSKIQPVIRFQDWLHIAKNDEHCYRYLSVFDLADIGGGIILKDAKRLNEAVVFSLNQLFAFLVNNVGLDKSKLRISYFAGGQVSDVTKGKYNFEQILSADERIGHWRSLGLTDEQFIHDKSRATLLALNVFGLPTPWGYRHEVNYLHEGKLLDIATFEYLFLRPIFEGQRVVKVRLWEHAFVISAIGLERVLMAKNNLKQITDCAHISPLVEIILSQSVLKNEVSARILCQALRVIHRIFSDCGSYKSLSVRRKEKMRIFYKAVFSAANELGLVISQENLKDWLDLNASLQEYSVELKTLVGRTVEEVMDAKSRFESDRSLKVKGV